MNPKSHVTRCNYASK